MIGGVFGIGGYYMSYNFLGIKPVAYRLCIAAGTYYSAMQLAQKVLGEKNYYDNYTVEEYLLLKE